MKIVLNSVLNIMNRHSDNIEIQASAMVSLQTIVVLVSLQLNLLNIKTKHRIIECVLDAMELYENENEVN
jgi:hypothetical protein